MYEERTVSQVGYIQELLLPLGYYVFLSAVVQLQSPVVPTLGHVL